MGITWPVRGKRMTRKGRDDHSEKHKPDWPIALQDGKPYKCVGHNGLRYFLNCGICATNGPGDGSRTTIKKKKRKLKMLFISLTKGVLDHITQQFHT